MDIDIRQGDLVFLTREYEEYWRKKHPNVNLSFVNRLAKLEEIIDWKSKKGKLLKKARKDSGKWGKLPIEESRYIFSIFYHEMAGRKGEHGVVERGVPFFYKNPESGRPFFVKAPKWLYKEIMKKCQEFEIVWKNDFS